ncbi:MAG TPA: DUF937 domain-containing protein [Trueperaceae bacterium]|nr:DUF937 domain-containing protein [Trueperaceae bacterium]
MSTLLNMLSEQLNPNVIKGISQQIGADQNQTSQAISALLPMMIGGMSKNVNSSPDNAASLNRALARDHNGSTLSHITGLLGGGQQQQSNPLASLMGNPAVSQMVLGSLLGGRGVKPKSSNSMDMLAGLLGGGGNGAAAQMIGGLLGGSGNNTAASAIGTLLGTAPTSSRGMNVAGMLGHILGNNTQPVQQVASKASGLDAGKIGSLMMLLAPILMGSLGKMKRQQGLNARGVADVLQRDRAQIEQKTGLGQGLLMQILDQNHSGGISDDMMKIGMNLAKNAIFGR